jgi:hypothetical protein
MPENCYNYTFTYIILLAIFAIGIVLLVIIYSTPMCNINGELKSNNMTSDEKIIQNKTFIDELQNPVGVSEIFGDIFEGNNLIR